MFKIKTYNTISVAGIKAFPHEKYEIGPDVSDADAILLRSQNLHDEPLPASLKAVARAGAGVNNVPVEKLSALGIPVFNTPGANANAVKELVLAGMLLACRNICRGWDYSRNLAGDDDSMKKELEGAKKQFLGFELPGRTLAVIGLGAIGVRLANAAISLGMRVVGFDPGISIQRAWELSAAVEKAHTIEQAIANADFISVHVPFNEHTKHLINADKIQQMQTGAVLLNFARGGIVDSDAVLSALNEDKLHSYVCDFPSNVLQNNPKVITLPHLGATTQEAQVNCATMAAAELRDFLENGEIQNSVNFPEAIMPRGSGYRVSIVNANVPNMLGQISTKLAEANYNIIDMLNKSRGDIAYTLVDVNQPLNDDVVNALAAIDGVLNVRVIHS